MSGKRTRSSRPVDPVQQRLLWGKNREKKNKKKKLQSKIGINLLIRHLVELVEAVIHQAGRGDDSVPSMLVITAPRSGAKKNHTAV